MSGELDMDINARTPTPRFAKLGALLAFIYFQTDPILILPNSQVAFPPVDHIRLLRI
jgi:hypothetical protein